MEVDDVEDDEVKVAKEDDNVEKDDDDDLDDDDDDGGGGGDEDEDDDDDDHDHDHGDADVMDDNVEEGDEKDDIMVLRKMRWRLMMLRMMRSRGRKMMMMLRRREMMMFSMMMLRRWSDPRPGTTLSASPSSQNALGNLTRAILIGHLQDK